MLRQRVITALVLLAVLLPALFSPAVWPFGLVSCVLIGVAGWEWGRLNGSGTGVSMVSGVTFAGLCALAVWWDVPTHVPPGAWWGANAFWVLGGAWVLRRGVAGWPRWVRGARLALGWFALGLSWLALSAAKGQGVQFVLSLLALVWMADVAAYFGGRAWGRRKLALSISPGKSWEGVYVGMVGVMCLAVAWVVIERALGGGDGGRSFLFQIWQRFGGVVLVLTAVYLAALGVMGDLLESLIKRAAGVKDSSGLLPGHGGVLDRIDALLPVFPAAMALASL